MVIFKRFNYPEADDPDKVGTYPPEVFAGGGYFYDKVLEYRVWSKVGGKTKMDAFATLKDAKNYARSHRNTEMPVVLVWQKEHINEPKPGVYVHVTQPRITEWQIDWLKGSQGTERQIPVFLKKYTK